MNRETSGVVDSIVELILAREGLGELLINGRETDLLAETKPNECFERLMIAVVAAAVNDEANFIIHQITCDARW